MGRRWTGMGLGLTLFATVCTGTCCFAKQQARSTAVRVSDDAASNSKSGHDKEESAPEVRPDHPWEDRENSVGPQLLKNIAQDQKALWIGPRSIRFEDADWLVPLGGAAAAMFVTDSSYSRHLSNSPNRIKYSKDLSNYGIAAMVGIGGGLWVLGHATHDDHKIETGILAGEAAIDSLAPVYAMKYAFGRERPLDSNYQGRFFHGGVSFPSEHAAAAWSIASVVAHEYPGPLTSLFAYGLASAISASRITGKQHFPSDVLVGSAIGWLEGMYVYRKHHDPKVGGGDWETYTEAHDSRERSTGSMGSPYVPLDSWIYPALVRLISQGYVSDGIIGMRPWTRVECARMVVEAEDAISENPNAFPEDQSLVDDLRIELSYETGSDQLGGTNRQIRLESLYTRFTNINGIPLFVGTHYDFGQTITNDFGRPYEQGLNNVSGFSGWASEGRWVTYVRAEYQAAPSGPALPQSAIPTIKELAHLPEATPFSSNRVPPASRVRLLDAYVGYSIQNWEFSFGKQSLWWGPALGTSMLLSTNIEPLTMFRINRTSPMKLPSILGWLGPVRVEFFVGQLDGHDLALSLSGSVEQIIGQVGVPLRKQPFIHGQKLSFKPTLNLELSFSRTTVFAGAAIPFTAHELWFSLLSASNGAPGTNLDPGDRRSAFDLTYRLPRLRRWLTFYADGFTDDQFSPVAYWDRSAWSAGIYIPQFPKVRRLDFRVEGLYTDLPIGGNVGRGFFYSNLAYPDGYTSYGNLIGSWIGRQGQGAQGWTTYSLSARSFVQLNYRHEKISQQLTPGGGTISDFGVKAAFSLNQNWELTGSVQHETWSFPILAARSNRNLTTSMELEFHPTGGNR